MKKIKFIWEFICLILLNILFHELPYYKIITKSYIDLKYKQYILKQKFKVLGIPFYYKVLETDNYNEYNRWYADYYETLNNKSNIIEIEEVI